MMVADCAEGGGGMAKAIAMAASVAVSLLFAAALLLSVRRGVCQLSGRQPYQPIEEAPRRRDYGVILLWVLAGGLAVYALGMVFNQRENNLQMGFWQLLEDTFNRADAPPYLSIAEHGYQTSGDAQNRIVFFPLFPWVVRVARLATGSYTLAALLVNNLCLYAACAVMYRLGCLDYGRQAALRAVRYVLVFPTAFFFRAALTEGLFFLLTALALYCCRKRWFVFAGLWGFLAALTRMTGLVVLGVILLEAFISTWEERDGFKKGFWAAFAKRGWPFALVAGGTAVYLLLNHAVFGNAFQFAVIQKEHWFNEFRPFPCQVYNTVAYLLDNTEPARVGLWLSQAVALPVFAALLLAGAGRLRVSHSAYNLAYYFGATSVSWLLSAPRYLMCMFPAFYTVALLAKRRWADITASALCAAAQVCLLWVFSVGWPIY